MVKAQLRKAWLWSRQNPVTIILVLVTVFGWITLADTRNDAKVTQRIVEQSPCTAAPAGRECQVLRNQIEKARPIRETCIPFRRVGYRCPVGEVREGVLQRGSNPSQPTGPDGGSSTNPVVPETRSTHTRSEAFPPNPSNRPRRQR